MSSVFITCAVTGAVHTPTMSPHLPITPAQDAADFRQHDRRVLGQQAGQLDDADIAAEERVDVVEQASDDRPQRAQPLRRSEHVDAAPPPTAARSARCC